MCQHFSKYSHESGSISGAVSYGEINFYPNILLHSKVNLYRESHLRVALTNSHHIYYNNFQFVDNFQYIDLYPKSHLLQYSVELGVREAEDPIFTPHHK